MKAPRWFCWAIILERSAAANTSRRFTAESPAGRRRSTSKREAALQSLIITLIRDGIVESAHDCSEGGLAVALAECTFDTGGIGVTREPGSPLAGDGAAFRGQCDTVR